MKNLKRSYDIRSADYEELIGRKPSWFIRGGITVILCFVTLIVLAGFFISYPDKVLVRATVISDPPPLAFFTRSSGYINLLTKDSTVVQRGQIIAQIGQNIQLGEVLYLEKLLDSFNQTSINDSIISKVLAEIHLGQAFGNFQTDYMQFYEHLNSLHLFIKYENYISNIEKYQRLMITNTQLSEKINEEINLYDKHLELTKNRVRIDSLLVAERVISKQEFENSKQTLLSQQVSLLRSLQSSINTESQIGEYHLQLQQMQNEKSKNLLALEAGLLSAIKVLKSDINLWKESNLIMANLDGLISFSKKWSTNEFIQNNTEFLKLIPTKFNRIEVLGYLPVTNSGKVQIGQKAIIKLDNYPYQEFGFLTGRLEKISVVPSDGNYPIILHIDQELTSSLKIKLAFKNEMQASVEIITKNRNIFTRIISKFIKTTS